MKKKYLRRDKFEDDDEIGALLDTILKKKELAHQLNVLVGGLQLRKSNLAQAIKEERARLKNFSFTPPERERHEKKLQLLEEESPRLDKELIEATNNYHQALDEYRKAKEKFKDTYVGLIVEDAEFDTEGV